GHELPDHHDNAGRDLRPKLVDIGRSLPALPIQLLDQGAAGERYLSSEQVVESATKTVEVGADVGAVRVLQLLGSDVVRGPDDRAVLSEGGNRFLRCLAQLIESRHPHIEYLEQTWCTGTVNVRPGYH